MFLILMRLISVKKENELVKTPLRSINKIWDSSYGKISKQFPQATELLKDIFNFLIENGRL